MRTINHGRNDVEAGHRGARPVAVFNPAAREQQAKAVLAEAGHVDHPG